MQNLILSYDLCQLIDEQTHFTENSSTLIELALVNNPSNVLLSDVISPIVPNLVQFHCPILVTLKFRKINTENFQTRSWLYDRGNYNHYRQKLNDANWDALFTSNNINEISDNITKHILTAAKDTIPNKKVTIRPNEPEWMNSKNKTLIRQRKRSFRKAKRTNTEHAWNKFKLKRNEVTLHLREGKIKYFQKLSQDLRNN